ncbi:hypothetical protein FNAPI_2787 [Fusarium napiforme]|uniref:Azaphilone pigments biosynthesis cluster protein L N-terminal domain-containing protein n=1 Tax=Fusarium napiforme TaxID=42672 RepID=A0A8H5JWG8_9HYPO|nr:hypothetical protein FNAPI_2787 [Fusarium napiforme]
MDPLSIASGAAGLAISCATIGKTLYTWIEDIVEVDENVSNLLEEVSILSRVLDSVSNASGRVPQAVVAEIDPGNALWGSISATLDDIKNTFNKLNQLMAELEKTNRFSRGFLRKPTKQIKFSLRSKDITVYKDRIKSYNTAMTGAFQMINVCLLIHSNSSQDSVFKALSEIKSQLRFVEVALHTSSSASPGPSSGREEDDRATQNLRQFVQVAESFHSSASTILREGPRSTVWGGSIMGDPLTEAQTSMIERWIPPPVNEEPRSHVDADSDSETEFARRIEELAIKNEAEGDHAKAEQFYRGAIEHGESSSRPGSDMIAMKIRLAYACMRQEKWVEADEIISPIAFERKTNDVLVYHGMHALALAYLDDSKLEEAEKCCKRALWGKRKVLGKDHLVCWETLSLLVRICTASNKMMEAEVHQSFIPNNATIATDQGALAYLDRSVRSLGRPRDDNDVIPQTQQPLDLQQKYPRSQPYTTAASGLVTSAGSFQYPKTFGSQYTSPPTPSSYHGMIQYPTLNRRTMSNGESYSDPTISRKAIGQPDPILSTMHRPERMGPYSRQQQLEQPRRSTNLSYDHNNDMSGFGLALPIPPPPHSTGAYPQLTQGANSYEQQGYQSPPPLEPYSMAPVPTPDPRCQIFVSIDFMNMDGATSVAYVVHDLKNPISEVLREWPGTGSYIGWGHDVANALGPTGNSKPGVQKVTGLPLLLVQVTEGSIPLLEVPEGLSAVDVSADFLYEVRHALRTQLQHCLGHKFLENEQRIHWILTSPTIIAQIFAEMARTKVGRMGLTKGSRIANKVYTKCVSDFEGRIISDFRNNGQEWDIDVGLETEFPEAGIKGGYMTYTNDEILSCFQPVMDGITAMMARIIGDTLVKSGPINGIILGGEFCTSEYLLREIKLKLPEGLRNKVYPPMEPATQVVTGAVHLALSRYLAGGQRYVQS